MVTSFGKSVEDLTSATQTHATDLLLTLQENGDGGFDAYSITDQDQKKKRIITKTATYTATAEDEIILCDATAGIMTINLPTAVGIAGVQYTIKKIDSGGNAITIDPNGAQTIEGSSTKTLSSQWSYYTIVSDGTNWIIIGS